jgi:hypothetical protein
MKINIQGDVRMTLTSTAKVAGAARVREFDLGFGCIVVSEIQEPETLANLV